MNIDERLEALTMNLELAHRDIQDLQSVTQDLQTVTRDLQGVVRDLQGVVRQDGENIRGLARIAEIHERRLSALEDDKHSE